MFLTALSKEKHVSGKLQINSITPHPSVEYWSVCKVEALFETPFLELVYRATQVHRKHFNPRAIQLSTLMSIKTGMPRRL